MSSSLVRHVCAAAVALVLLLTSASQAAATTTTIGFESSADLAQFFQFNQPSELTAGGAPGGAVRIQNPAIYANSRLIYNQPFSLSNQYEAVTTSMMFHYDGLVEVSNGGGVGVLLASLHLATDPNYSATSRWLEVSCSASQYEIGGPITFNISMSRLLGGSGQGFGPFIEPLVDDHWYQLAARFSFEGGNTNGIQVTLTDFGTDGATPETFAQRSYFPANSVPVIQDDTVWAGFGMGFAKGHGNDRSDNFTIAQVVPEPATGLVGLMAAGALTAMRRRGIGRRD